MEKYCQRDPHLIAAELAVIDEHQYRQSGRLVSAVAVGGWAFVSQQHQDF
jgi:hypothetical protein